MRFTRIAKWFIQNLKSGVLCKEPLSTRLIGWLILISLLVECYGLFSPVLGSNDSNFYSTIAKHIVTSNDWLNLYYANHDWLDKPRLPFWCIALSYKIFGTNTFAYIFPGFLFNLLGGYFTYKLGRYLYDHKTGLIATLLYFSSLHLMLSAIDVRAEAFLLGEILPACYFWLRYNDSNIVNYRYLCLGAFFTALAIMTKGLFVLVTIYSGIVALWLYTRQYKNFINTKWLYAIGLSLIFSLPELICLFLQFDLHPEKVVFGKTAVSGLKFFFWDSQFGRFFNFGPYLSSSYGDYAHYFYFMHTFMWAFLPWSVVFLAALYHIFVGIRSNTKPFNQPQSANFVFLLTSFFITFILFSCTNFQLDHYINIILPFAGILCANWLCTYAAVRKSHWLFIAQIALVLILFCLVIFFSFLLFNSADLIAILILSAVVLIVYTFFTHKPILDRAIISSVLVINLVFIFTQMANNKIYINYDAGYQIATFLQTKSSDKIFDYQVNSSSLEFHVNASYQRLADVNELYATYLVATTTKDSVAYFLVVPEELSLSIPGTTLLKKFDTIPQNKFNLLLLTNNLSANIKKIALLKFVNTQAKSK